nr:MAG TPA: hypothetical protein [Caudoviricetes sp.]
MIIAYCFMFCKRQICLIYKAEHFSIKCAVSYIYPLLRSPLYISIIKAETMYKRVYLRL